MMIGRLEPFMYEIRSKYFPALDAHGIVYLDNAATTQVPEYGATFYQHKFPRLRGNPHRGLYALSEEASEIVTASRRVMQSFIHAEHPEEIIFTGGTTDSLNMLAHMMKSHIHEGDEIIVSIDNHHSNMLPWMELARQTGAKIVKLIPEDDGTIFPKNLSAAMSAHTKIVAIPHIGNVYGNINNIQGIADIVHAVNAWLVVDAAQSVMHRAVDVKKMNCDFLAFSGHKMCGPTGVGVLYGKKEILRTLYPDRQGGGMVEYADMDTGDVQFLGLPERYEAGSLNTAGIEGIAGAAEFLKKVVGIGITWAEDVALTACLMNGLRRIPHINIIGGQENNQHYGLVSFTVDGVHPHDVAAILGEYGICVRAGQMCAQPLMKHLGIHSCVRASVAFYNTPDDIRKLCEVLESVRGKMGVR